MAPRAAVLRHRLLHHEHEAVLAVHRGQLLDLAALQLEEALAQQVPRVFFTIIVVPIVFSIGVALLNLLRHGPRLLQSMADPPRTGSWVSR